MNNMLTKAYLTTVTASAVAKNLIQDEAKRLKDDERGMELLQILLIILFVVVIAAAVWLLLGDWIRDLIDQIGDPPTISL